MQELPVDSSLISYQPQQEDNLVLMNPNEGVTPSYSSQDILAEALANTNVLECEPSIPTLVMGHGDTPLILNPPVVHETSITLQTPIMTPVEVPSAVVPNTEGLQPPPLPPSPTEDVLMEESEMDLIEQADPTNEEAIVDDTQEMHIETVQHVAGDFYIDDSQGEEVNSFQSMPLLNEESTASEEPISGQNFDEEYLPSSTNRPDLRAKVEDGTYLTGQQQEEQICDEEVAETTSLPLIPEEQTDEPDTTTQPSQETEVSSTTVESTS